MQSGETRRTQSQTDARSLFKSKTGGEVARSGAQRRNKAYRGPNRGVVFTSGARRQKRHAEAIHRHETAREPKRGVQGGRFGLRRGALDPESSSRGQIGRTDSKTAARRLISSAQFTDG